MGRRPRADLRAKANVERRMLEENPTRTIVATKLDGTRIVFEHHRRCTALRVDAKHMSGECVCDLLYAAALDENMACELVCLETQHSAVNANVRDPNGRDCAKMIRARRARVFPGLKEDGRG